MKEGEATDWVLSLPARTVGNLGHLRLDDRVEILIEEERAWIRGNSPLSGVLSTIAGIAEVLVYLNRGGSLSRPGRRLPERYLPPGTWRPLKNYIVPVREPLAMTFVNPASATLGLIRTAAQDPVPRASMMLVSAEILSTWIETAPAVRLHRLRFATSEDGWFLVEGHPLPPLEGTRFIRMASVAVPCGFTFHPPLDPILVEEVLGMTEGDLALFHEDSGYELIPCGSFLPMRRSAIRQSCGRIQDLEVTGSRETW